MLEPTSSVGGVAGRSAHQGERRENGSGVGKRQEGDAERRDG